MELFACIILKGNGDRLRMAFPYGHVAYLPFLNFFCSLSPVEWIGTGANHKIVLCDDNLKQKISGICSSLKSVVPEMSQINQYFTSTKDNYNFAFLREGALPAITEDLIHQSRWMAAFNDFKINYNFETFGDKTYNEYTGPSSLKDCTCRFCGKSNPEAIFKHENAHAIPDALGNKKVFCNDECTKCNNELSPIDKTLVQYLDVRRSEFKIRNKRNKIVNARGHVFDYNGTTEKLRISKFAIVNQTDKEYQVKLEGALPTSHLNIYKALAKVAIDLMPRDEVSEFETTIDWIKGEFTPTVLPNVYYGYRENYVEQPQAVVITRKPTVSSNVEPKCLIALTITDLTFIYIVPFAQHDSMYSDKSVLKYIDFILPLLDIKEKNPIPFEFIDMTDRVGKFPHVYEWVSKDKCEIVEQTEFDSIQEKDPNIVHFPELDKSKISIIENTIFCDNLATQDKALISVNNENCRIRFIEHQVDSDYSSGVINFAWHFTISTLHGNQTLLDAMGIVRAYHKRIFDVANKFTQEISPFMMEYMLEEACRGVKNKHQKEMPNFNFDNLHNILLESIGTVLHPKEDVEQSLMKDYL